MSESESIPAELDRISVVTSRGKSKWDYIKTFTKEIDTNLTTFDELINQVNNVKMALRDTGSFNNVNVVIDTSSEYAKASPNGYQVIFELDEKRLNLSTNTGMDIDKANPSTTFNLTLPNLFGRGETVNIEFGRECKYYEKSRGLLPNLAATFNKKLLDGKTSLTAELKHDYSEKEWSNVSEENMTGQLQAAYQLNDKLTVKTNCTSRLVNLLGLSTKEIPLELREQFGYAKKNAVSVEAVYDGTVQDGGVVPTWGDRARAHAEYWPGHVKVTADYAKYATLANHITMKVGGQVGHINSLQNQQPHFSDRFFLGGTPGALRGFKKCQVGEFQDGCALGGGSMWSVGAHLYSRLDLLSKLSGGLVRNYLSPNIGLHAFAEAGNVANTPQATFSKDYSASYGLGFALALNPQVQLELNYCQRFKGDQAKFKPGWNGGFSISI